jgi:hypothetical protein
MIPILLSCAKVLSSPFHLFRGNKSKDADEKAAAADDPQKLSLAKAYAALFIGALFLLTLAWLAVVARGVLGVVGWIVAE